MDYSTLYYDSGNKKYKNKTIKNIRGFYSMEKYCVDKFWGDVAKCENFNICYPSPPRPKPTSAPTDCN